MSRPPLDDSRWATLDAMTIEALRNEWTRVCPHPPPRGLKRDLLCRGIAFAWQAAKVGGLSARLQRRLRQGVVISTRPRLTPGTRLVRSWQGETHQVLVLAAGVEYRGQPYASLSAVARVITGTHWSGPRFFGVGTNG